MSFHDGETVTFSCAFTVSAVATDPDTVTLKTESEAGTKTTYTYAGGDITKDSVGNYSKKVTLTAGVWQWRWEGVLGTVTAPSQGSVVVEANNI